jgi:hypothetical protein
VWQPDLGPSIGSIPIGPARSAERPVHLARSARSHALPRNAGGGDSYSDPSVDAGAGTDADGDEAGTEDESHALNGCGRVVSF